MIALDFLVVITVADDRYINNVDDAIAVEVAGGVHACISRTFAVVRGSADDRCVVGIDRAVGVDVAAGEGDGCNGGVAVRGEIDRLIADDDAGDGRRQVAGFGDDEVVGAGCDVVEEERLRHRVGASRGIDNCAIYNGIILHKAKASHRLWVKGTHATSKHNGRTVGKDNKDVTRNILARDRIGGTGHGVARVKLAINGNGDGR